MSSGTRVARWPVAARISSSSSSSAALGAGDGDDVGAGLGEGEGGGAADAAAGAGDEGDLVGKREVTWGGCLAASAAESGPRSVRRA